MPDNALYYHAAYATAAMLYAGYALSLIWRARRIRRKSGNGAFEA
jgi:hypothetical protein